MILLSLVSSSLADCLVFLDLQRFMRYFTTGFLLPCLPFLLVQASRGDRLVEFRDCAASCEAEHCDRNGINYIDNSKLPLILQLTLWDCASDCDYQCQRSITGSLLGNGLRIEQFHGKWPFKRLYGVQEPASVLFSILNGLVHYNGLQAIRRNVPSTYPMKRYYIWWSLVSINAWVWSAFFHIRDFPLTEKLDYFSAGAAILYGQFYAPIRVFRWYESRSYGTLVRSYGFMCAAALALHIAYLTLVKFDYGYNMLANVAVGACHSVVWIYHSMRHFGSRPFWATWPAILVLTLAGAMSLELFDFPPYRDSIDAHSLWHASTIPITMCWYKFLEKDSMYEISMGSNKTKEDLR